MTRAATPFSGSQQARRDTDTPGLVKIKLKEHPAIRFSNLDMIEVDGIRDIVPPDNALIIAETVDKKALIYKTVIKDRSAYVINFDPLKANFFLNVNFPGFVVFNGDGPGRP